MTQPCVLICTIGGSHEPIVTGILTHRPRLVHFLCSDDVGKQKGSYTQVLGEGKIIKSRRELERPDLPNIPAQAGLQTEQLKVHRIKDFDDLNGCYLKSVQVLAEIRRASPDARIVVDYTGGTKSMTAGLAAAALDDGGCEISLVVGRRGDLVAVQSQTEFVRPVHVWDAQALRRVHAAREVLVRYDYAAAEQVLRDATARFAGEQTISMLQRGIALCRVFDAWDKFQHSDARRLLQPYQSHFVNWWRILGVLAGDSEGHGFEWVEDLLMNAERRGSQERFDDAVGRFYRAAELTAQVWLRLAHGIETSDVQFAGTPESYHPSLERCRDADGRIKIGLLLAWDLIAAIPDDPLGIAFAAQRGRMLDFLKVRNSSLFAHGLRPVSNSDFRLHGTFVTTFLRSCIDAAIANRSLRRPVVLQQFPNNFLESATDSIGADKSD